MSGNRQHRFNNDKSYMTKQIVSCDEMTGLVHKGRAMDAIYLSFSKSIDIFSIGLCPLSTDICRNSVEKLNKSLLKDL